MEPLSTGLVLSWLARYAGHLVGIGQKSLDDALVGRMGDLWNAIAGRFGRNPSAEDSLERLRQQPDNPRRQAAVEDHLEDALADGGFADEVRRLLANLERPGAISDTHVSDSGAVAVGGSVTIHAGQFAAGRDLVIPAGAPSSPGLNTSPGAPRRHEGLGPEQIGPEQIGPEQVGRLQVGPEEVGHEA
jgi:hypothetical protein